jgi:hypothetical protein
MSGHPDTPPLSAAPCEDRPGYVTIRYPTRAGAGRVTVRLDCLELRPSGRNSWALVVLTPPEPDSIGQRYRAPRRQTSRGTLLRLQNGSVDALEALGVRKMNGSAKPKSAPWRRGTFTIQRKDTDPREVYGYVRGGYGLHQKSAQGPESWERGGRWILTHLLSGLAVRDASASRAELAAVADRLEARVPELAETDPVGPAYDALRARVGAAVRDVDPPEDGLGTGEVAP